MMISTLQERPELKSRGTVLIALLMYIATSLFIWFFTLPSLGVFETRISQKSLIGPSLASHLEYARNQAIQRQQPVTICASENGLGCSGGNQWISGWIVFTDSDSYPGQFNSDDKLLYAYAGEHQTPALKINASYVRYLENGGIELE